MTQGAGRSAHALRIAAVEPYFGGSHRHFLRDLERRSKHEIELFTLPARFWKWRLRGSSLQLARDLNAFEKPFDALFCSDFVNLPDLRALLRPELRVLPVLYYLHENQLTYPLSPDEEFDPYFGFTNVLSCLSAEAVVFNSEFHRRVFLGRLPDTLPRLPDYDPGWVVDTIAGKSEVLHVGLDGAELESLRPFPTTPCPDPDIPRVLWNHRWEFDKQPERFFDVLEKLTRRGVPFTADVVGESFARRPAVFDTAREKLAARFGHFGTIESRNDYVRLLWRSDVVVSTAKQEFFGISMAEATFCGAYPIAPTGLVYDDFYSGPCAELHLYEDDASLERLLHEALTRSQPSHPCVIPDRMRRFDWARMAPLFDTRFESLVHEHVRVPSRTDLPDRPRV